MSTSETSGRKRMGKQKIEIKKMTNKSNLQVTFSKRRNGLLKIASELCTLCGVELALIIFSPGGKVFSFGHPSVEVVIQRYLSQVSHQSSAIDRYIEAQRSTNVRGLNVQLSQLKDQLAANKNQGEELNRLCKAARAQFGWACQVEEMGMPQLEQFEAALVELQKKITLYRANATTNPPTHQFFGVVGGPSNAMVPVQHPPPLPPQVFPQQFFQGGVLQANHMFDFNNVGGYGGAVGGYGGAPGNF